MILLVADDDRLIRFMMKSMLSEILTSDDTILEAANGKEMAELCQKKMPDIVFADIKMPYMSGIEAIRECRQYSQGTEFVLISGYSEFEYAQQALKLGVSDYLLKPVEEEQLRSVVEKLKGKIAAHKKASNSWFQLKLFNMFNYFSTVGTEDEEEEEPFSEGTRYEVIGLLTRCGKKNLDFLMEFQKEVISRMNDLGKEMVKKDSFYSQIYSAEGTPYFVFCTTQSGREEIASYVRRISLSLKNERLAYHFLGFSKDRIREVYRECERLDAGCGMELNYPIGAFLRVSQTEISEVGRDIIGLTRQILDAWEAADGVSYKERLNEMYRKYREAQTDVRLDCISRYCSLVMQQEIPGESCREFCKAFVDQAESMYGNVAGGDSDVIDRVKAYVEKNYMNDIGIGQIAELFDITPNYLSTIFHQKAGCKFVDYLTEVRIANAKRLLIQNSTASVKDIAVMAGYNSSRYFATLFQKMTGMKPSAYRKENMDV